jgi:hypothetical protein
MQVKRTRIPHTSDARGGLATRRPPRQARVPRDCACGASHAAGDLVHRRHLPARGTRLRDRARKRLQLTRSRTSHILPKSIVARLHEEVVKLSKDAEFVRLYASYGMDPVASTPEAFVQYLLDEIAKWGRSSGRQVYACNDVRIVIGLSAFGRSRTSHALTIWRSSGCGHRMSRRREPSVTGAREKLSHRIR